MRKTKLTVLIWLLILTSVSSGIFAGYAFGDDGPGHTAAGIVLTVFGLLSASFVYLFASDSGNGQVVTSNPGTRNHDLIFGENYRVVSCAFWRSRRAEGPSGYTVVLEDMRGALWSCILPEEPPTYFVYARGEKRFVPYATPATATPTPATPATGKTATAS